MAELNNNNMEQNTALNEQEVKAAEAAVGNTVPAAPEKKKPFAKGTKSRKIAGGLLVGVGALVLGGVGFALGKIFGNDKADNGVIDADYTDVTAPADDTVPFDNNVNTDNF